MCVLFKSSLQSKKHPSSVSALVICGQTGLLAVGDQRWEVHFQTYSSVYSEQFEEKLIFLTIALTLVVLVGSSMEALRRGT